MADQSSQKLPQGERWRDLAALSQKGDKTAYHQLLSELFPYIRNFLIGRLADQDAAEDIAQEVLISVHKSLKTYHSERPFTPWLMAIISFRKTDYLRRYYSRKQDMKTDMEGFEAQKNHVTNPTHAGEYKDVEAALGSLPDKQRAVFEMVKIKGMTASEVAKEMQMSVSAVKVSAHRTQKKLQGILK